MIALDLRITYTPTLTEAQQCTGAALWADLAAARLEETEREVNMARAFYRRVARVATQVMPARQSLDRFSSVMGGGA